MLNDLLQPGFKLVFCGTVAGIAATRRKACYEGRGNLLWRILQETGLGPRQLSSEEYAPLPQFGIGLTDIVKGLAGIEHSLAAEDFERETFERQIREAMPGIVCNGGNRGASAYLQVNQVEFGARWQSGYTKIFYRTIDVRNNWGVLRIQSPARA